MQTTTRVRRAVYAKKVASADRRKKRIHFKEGSLFFDPNCGDYGCYQCLINRYSDILREYITYECDSQHKFLQRIMKSKNLNDKEISIRKLDKIVREQVRIMDVNNI